VAGLRRRKVVSRFGRRSENLVRTLSVGRADEQFGAIRKGQRRPETARVVRSDDRFNASGFEGRMGELGLEAIGKRSYNDEVAHGFTAA